MSAVTNIIYAVKDLGIAFKGVSASVGAFGTVFGTVMAGVVSFLAGAEIGKKLGAWLFPEDADIYEHYSGIKGTFEMLRDLVVTIGEEIYYKWQDIIQFFKDAFVSVKKFAVDAWNGIKEAFGNAVEWFTKLFEGISKAIGKIMDGVVGIVKKPINAIISLLNTFIDGLNKIQVPDWVPTVGGKGINIPHIKQLAEGGVLRKGQMGFLEGNGAEAVVPLDQNRKWIHAVSQDLRESLASEGLVGSSQLGTRKLGNTIYNFNQTNNSPRALNRLEIYRQTRNQLAMVNGGV